jgi:ubiquinone/menaquinone biosynthesis C-methylase UbiE
MTAKPSPKNADSDVTEGFGAEWSTFRQGDEDLMQAEREEIFQSYFRIFPWDRLPAAGTVGADIGCGSGRWAQVVAGRVGHLHLLDASSAALIVAKDNLARAGNVSFHLASVGAMPIAPASLDFAYSLGVLHHVPDTEGALRAVAETLKPGAPFLVYLYYAFDNRPRWYRMIWQASNLVRQVMWRLPHPLRFALSQIIAALVYWPLARFALLLEQLGGPANAPPLAWYRDKSFYVMRTDAYDRFCTKLEKRFTREQITRMLEAAGFADVLFSDREPFWCAVAFKR